MQTLESTIGPGATASAVPVRLYSDSRPAGAVRRGVLALVAGGAMLAMGATAQAAMPPDSFADLAAKVTPAVVNISSTHAVKGSEQEDESQLPFDVPPGSPFEEFFKHFQQQFGDEGGRPHKVTALGSGFIIDPSGYVVTNNHVIDQATDIHVTLTTGKDYPAKLVGTDPKTDLALLKIKAASPLPYVSFGDSDKTRVGDWVLAVGNPFGLGGTVTTGIVSARGRDIHSGPFDNFLQIDASINRGNSGGPTFNLDGEVVGINTAIASPNGGSVGIGFAIPANLAKPVVAQLREHGSVQRGWLGVQIQEVSPEIASALGLEEPKGALVSAVQPNSPAEKAKLQQGDVIVEFNGKPIDEMRKLPLIVADVPAGKTVDVTVWRDHRKVTLPVTIAKLKDEDQKLASTESSDMGDQSQASDALGVKLAAITPKTREQYNLPDGAHGVLVVDVDADGPAADQGLKAGDVIVQVAQTKVDSPADVDRLAEKAKEANQKALLLLVSREGNELFLAVKLGTA